MLRDNPNIKNLFANVCYSDNVAHGLEQMGPRAGESVTIQAITYGEKINWIDRIKIYYDAFIKSAKGTKPYDVLNKAYSTLKKRIDEFQYLNPEGNTNYLDYQPYIKLHLLDQSGIGVTQQLDAADHSSSSWGNYKSISQIFKEKLKSTYDFLFKPDSPRFSGHPRSTGQIDSLLESDTNEMTNEVSNKQKVGESIVNVLKQHFITFAAVIIVMNLLGVFLQTIDPNLTVGNIKMNGLLDASQNTINAITNLFPGVISSVLTALGYILSSFSFVAGQSMDIPFQVLGVVITKIMQFFSTNGIPIVNYATQPWGGLVEGAEMDITAIFIEMAVLSGWGSIASLLISFSLNIALNALIMQF